MVKYIQFNFWFGTLLWYTNMDQTDGDSMKKAIYIDKKLYDGINGVSLYNKNEQIMVAGGMTYGNAVFIDTGSLP